MTILYIVTIQSPDNIITITTECEMKNDDDDHIIFCDNMVSG